MRVLRINDWTGPPGGTESYVSAVARELEAAGHPQLTVSITDAMEVSEYRPQAWERVLPLRPMGPTRLVQDLGGSPRSLARLRKLADDFHPDLVHLHHFDSWFTPMARFLHRLEVPLVMTAHDAKLVCPIATLVLPDGSSCEGGILPRCGETGCDVGRGLRYKLRMDKVFRDLVAPDVRLFICPSTAASTFMDHNGFRPTRVLPPFIEVPAKVHDRPPAWPQGPPTVGFLGRVEAYKGGATLLEAVARARPKVPGLRVLFAGRGPDRLRLEAKAATLRLASPQDVEFRGWVSGREKERFFEEVHVLAVPSEGYENFGLIGLEAMVRGRPVFGSRLGGIPNWLLEGVTGRLLKPGDVDGWTRAIVEGFADPGRLQAWGRAGRERYLANFEPRHHLTGLLSIYEEVLRKGPGGSARPRPAA